ncbi:MAG: tetratricopeptide repeat protein, partial [Cyanobacteria bacterium P01_B01_bin.77]
AKYARAIVQRGITYRVMKRYEDALNDFNQAIELDDRYDWIVILRGITYRVMERYEDALSDFNQAIQLDSESSFIVAERGFTYLFFDHYEDAVRDFEKAIQLDSKDDWYLYLRALGYLKLNESEKSLSSLNQAISIAAQEYEVKSDSYLNMFNLALYHLVSRNIQDAVKYYEKAVNICENTYDVETAITDLEDFSKLFPEHQGVTVVLQLLKSKLNELKDKSFNGL